MNASLPKIDILRSRGVACLMGLLLLALLVLALAPGWARAQDRLAGPPSVADLAEQLLDSVVNISTSQRVAPRRALPMPNLPEG